MTRKTIKFKKPKLPRLPKPPDMTAVRGDYREIMRQLRVAREKYMRDCQESCKELRGKPLADCLVLVSKSMIEAGLYSDGPSVGQTAYCIMLWFARFEAGSDWDARHQTWPALRGMTGEIVREMRNKYNRRHKRQFSKIA